MADSPWYVGNASVDELTKRKELYYEDDIYDYLSDIINLGYCVIPNSVSTDLVDECASSFYTFKEKALPKVPTSEAGKYRRIVNLHCALPKLAQLFTHNKAIAVLKALFEQDPTLYTSLFYEIGSGQDLHRDTPYFWTYPPYAYFGVWVALEDTDANNGSLQVLESSNQIEEEDRLGIGKLFYTDSNEIPSSDHRLWEEYQGRVLQKGQDFGLKCLSLHVSKGDTVIWHPQTMHGGCRIVDTERTRLSIAIHSTPENVPVYGHDAFFNPERELKPARFWNYQTDNGVKYIKHKKLSFEHIYHFEMSEFLQT